VKTVSPERKVVGGEKEGNHGRGEPGDQGEIEEDFSALEKELQESMIGVYSISEGWQTASPPTKQLSSSGFGGARGDGLLRYRRTDERRRS